MRRGDRELATPSFEEWLLSFPHKVAPEWCAKYVSEIGQADVQSKQSVLKLATADIVVRFSIGVNHPHGGKTDRFGRELPELDFWQSSVGLSGINLENEHLTGMLGETSRPVQDTNGHVITKVVDAPRGTVAAYRVSGPAGKDFGLLHLDVSTTPRSIPFASNPQHVLGMPIEKCDVLGGSHVRSSSSSSSSKIYREIIAYGNFGFVLPSLALRLYTFVLLVSNRFTLSPSSSVLSALHPQDLQTRHNSLCQPPAAHHLDERSRP